MDELQRRQFTERFWQEAASRGYYPRLRELIKDGYDETEGYGEELLCEVVARSANEVRFGKIDEIMSSIEGGVEIFESILRSCNYDREQELQEKRKAVEIRSENGQAESSSRGGERDSDQRDGRVAGRRFGIKRASGVLAEKLFEEFSEGERTLWQRIKAAMHLVR